MTEQLYQVWDWNRNAVQSYHQDQQTAEREAERLNTMQAMNWNGLQRYQAMEAKD